MGLFCLVTSVALNRHAGNLAEMLGHLGAVL